MDSEEPPLKKPKQKRQRVETEKLKAQRAKYLKPWPKGKSTNTGGRPKQHAEVVARIRENSTEILDTLFGLMRKARLSPGDKTRYMVCEALLDRGFGRAPHTLAAAIQHHTALDGTAIHLEGAAMSPLLQAAHAHIADEAQQQLRSPDEIKAIDVTPEPISPELLPDVIAMPPPEPLAPSSVTGKAKCRHRSSNNSRCSAPHSGIKENRALHLLLQRLYRQTALSADPNFRCPRPRAKAPYILIDR